MNKLKFFVLLGIFASPYLQAQDLISDSEITAVTVFNDRAAITRTVEAQLDSGETTIIIKGLPGNILVDSLRVSGKGLGKIEIGSVEAQRAFTDKFNNEVEAEIQQNIQDLQDQRKDFQNQIEALDLQKTFMQSLVQTQPKIMREEMEIGNLDPKNWQQAWALLQNGSAEMLKARTTAIIAQRTINKEIKLFKQQLSKLSTGQKQTIDAHIALETNQETTGVLYLEYQIPGAGWQAIYDARLDSNNSTLRLDQLASVSQVTGEDWNNVKLTLSTHMPSINTNFAPLSPWLLNFYRHDVGYLQKPKRANAPKVDALDEVVSTGNRIQTEADFKQVKISSTTFSAEYIIPGKVSLKSERNSRKFKIQDQTFATDLLVMAAPQRSSKAYLHAKVNYTGDSPLLPGKVSLFRDNAFVGNSHLSLLNPDEDVKLSFGIDDAIKIEHKALAEEKGTNGIIDKRDFITRNYKTLIHNYHTQAIDIRILDRLPSSQHEDIKVEISKKHSKPTFTDLDENVGILAWDFTLKSNGEKNLEFGYTISYPKGNSIY